jgi:hypothetical protein
MTDAVEKRFLGVERATLIQKTDWKCNIDSKLFPPGFENCVCDAIGRFFRLHRPKVDVAPHRRGAEAHTLRRYFDASERQRLELLGEL